MMHTSIRRIFYQDEHCAVVYKKAGEDSQSFFSAIFPDKPFVQPVNRLDKPVSGLIVAAFSPQIQAVCSRAFTQCRVEKEYWAVCLRPPEPVPLAGMQRLEHCLSFNTKTQKASVYRDAGCGSSGLREDTCGIPELSGRKNRRNDARAGGKPAVLYWLRCGSGVTYDFLKIFPKTGRTHQIRVQMAAIGRPVKGDLKYGAPRSEKNGGIRLHAYSLRLLHPVTGIILAAAVPPQEPDTLWAACTAACTANTTGCPQ